MNQETGSLHSNKIRLLCISSKVGIFSISQSQLCYGCEIERDGRLTWLFNWWENVCQLAKVHIWWKHCSCTNNVRLTSRLILVRYCPGGQHGNQTVFANMPISMEKLFV